MKCKVCGAESGKYPLCRACNFKKEKGEIIKCTLCGNWHKTNVPCLKSDTITRGDKYLYDVKKALISKSEDDFFIAIKRAVPVGYYVFPQINLASFINRTDDARYHNELFRNVDFLITDGEYYPKFIIEINDQSHLTKERKERDEKVRKICEEAGIPIVKLWTSYGVNPEYIKNRIDEVLAQLPVPRVHHFSLTLEKDVTETSSAKKKNGCYVATCVYGSYDCPEVWVLRRFRDAVLSKRWMGKIFIKIYYSVSPIVVKLFGKCTWFVRFCKSILDKIVSRLQLKGYENTRYDDKM